MIKKPVLLLFILLVAACATPAEPIEPTAIPTSYFVTLICEECDEAGKGINVWSDVESSSLVFELYDGAEVQVIGEKTIEGVRYLQIRNVNGQGWVNAESVQANVSGDEPLECPRSEAQAWFVPIEDILNDFNADYQVELDIIEDAEEFERQRIRVQERLDVLNSLTVPECLEEIHAFLVLSQEIHAESVDLFADNKDDVAKRRSAVSYDMLLEFYRLLEIFSETYFNPQI